MSETGVPHGRAEQVRAVMDAINARDLNALDGLPFDPELEFRSVVGAAEGEVYRGLQGLRRWAETVDEIWEGFLAEVAEIHEAADDKALVVLRLTGQAKASGIPLDVDLWQVWTWRDGLIRRNDAYTEPEEAFRAAGLGP